MNTSYLVDECLQNLFYAEEAMKSWIPLTEYEILFESGINKEVKDKILQNEKTEEKSVSFVQKAINSVITLITNLINSIAEFIGSIFGKGSDQPNIDDVEDAMQKDPKLKNKKISIRKSKVSDAEYDQYLKRIDAEIRAVEADPKHPIDMITNDINTLLNGGATAAIILGTEVAVKAAKSNIEVANRIKKALDDEKSLMKLLSDKLGKHGANSFKHKIDAAAKNTKLRQLKVRLLGHRYSSLQECVQSVFGAFKKFNLNTIILGGKLLANKNTRDVAKTVIKGELELKKMESNKKKREKQEEKDAKKIEKEHNRKQKQQKEQPNTGVYAPMTDFLFGTNQKSK